MVGLGYFRSALGAAMLTMAASEAGAAGINVCGDARLCAHIGQGGTAYSIKGVADVTNPATGVTCIRPTSRTLNLKRIVPSVSVDVYTSEGSDLLAFYNASSSTCGAGYIEVRTYDFHGAQSSRVAFTLVAD